MSKQNLLKFINGVKLTMTKHSPEILTGIGIAGMVTTTVLAVKATPKALYLLEEARKEKIDKQVASGVPYEEVKNELETMEKVKAAYKPYIPVFITGALSISCLIGASSVHLRRNAALATAYKLSETALSEYKEKVIETVGEKKEKVIKDNIAKSKIEKDPVSKKEIFITKKGETLCYDAITGRYFKSDIEEIKKAINVLNRNLIDTHYISLNDFFDEIGLANTRLGEELGWNLDDGLIDVHFNSQLAEDGTPCLVVDYLVAPRYDYYKFM